MARASTSKKPISLYPLSFKEAITSLLKVAPPTEPRDELPTGKAAELPQA